MPATHTLRSLRKLTPRYFELVIFLIFYSKIYLYTLYYSIMVDISLLLASRGSRTKLEDLFQNLKNTTLVPSRIEILIKIDRDDQELLAYYNSNEWHKWDFNIDFLITDRNGGYFGLSHAYN